MLQGDKVTAAMPRKLFLMSKSFLSSCRKGFEKRHNDFPLLFNSPSDSELTLNAVWTLSEVCTFVIVSKYLYFSKHTFPRKCVQYCALDFI